jgi:hypothetical protein
MMKKSPSYVNQGYQNTGAKAAQIPKMLPLNTSKSRAEMITNMSPFKPGHGLLEDKDDQRDTQS